MAEIRAGLNYDEAKVPAYTLPSALGGKASSPAEWENIRRPEIVNLFKRKVYGETLPLPEAVKSAVISEKDDALNNTAIRREIKLTWKNQGRSHSAVMLLYIPKNAPKPCPVFVGLNFRGNHTVTNETDVLKTGFDLDGSLLFADEKRGSSACRFQFEETVKRGYASATLCYHDIFPDMPFSDYQAKNSDIVWQKSVCRIFFPESSAIELNKKYSAIGVWAWGISRMADFLAAMPEIAKDRMALHGHSRLGKTALWAGALDTRFKLVISNDSGCGGAALFKRCYGQTAEAIHTAFPHWFAAEFGKYSGREADMPFDQHWLISLIAPRDVCIASATLDRWADPKGEFLSGIHAGEVYRLLGRKALPENTPMPKADGKADGDGVYYHLRTGKHDQQLPDWEHYWSVADKVL